MLKASIDNLVSPLKVIGGLLAQVAALTIFLMFVLESETVARTFFSQATWQWWLVHTGGELQQTPQGLMAAASLGGLVVLSTLLVASLTTFSAWSATWHQTTLTPVKAKSGTAPRTRFGPEFQSKALANAWWSLPMVVWSAGWILSLLIPGLQFITFLMLSARLALAATLSGWLWELTREWFGTTSSFAQPDRDAESSVSRCWSGVLGGMAIYIVVFTAMNWGLWFNLQIPHGDSSMYEEHLWNVLHGKGFRSYLDQGLFLGEHIQVVHLLLLPLYVLWPSHLFMELSESIALASGAIPVYFIARRHGQSSFAAMLMSWAYLLYFPMQFLDIAIDLKTFRPSAYGFPALLFMIDAAERRRWGWMALCIAISLSVQEDYGIPVASYGIWLLCEGIWQWRQTREAQWRAQIVAGALMTILAPLYVVWAVKYAIPWFRSGVTVHYASYFQDFGKTPVEIVINILTNPLLLLSRLVTAGSIALLIDLLLPIGMPLRAWRRLLIGVPLFVLLSLNELTRDFPGPFHHFHAPLVPLLVWAACCALSSKSLDEGSQVRLSDQRGLWAFCTALATGFFFSLSPLGISFWDAGGVYYWKKLYVPDERAREFTKVYSLIPQNARVASTDFVHPRFTHHERSYDYSNYPRRVANYEDKVPDDTDYIVIDTGHRYSEIKSYEQTREYRNQRDQWEVVPVDTKGYFIVLKRLKPSDSAE